MSTTCRKQILLPLPHPTIRMLCQSCLPISILYLLVIILIANSNIGVHSFAMPPQQQHPTTIISPSHEKEQHLVLIGGGHAHVQVIKSLNKFKRPKHVKVTLIDMQQSAVYSGMVPGCISGLYEFEEALIKLEPLAKWSDIQFIQGEVTDVDPDARVVILQDGSSLEYDVLSIDIGSRSNGVERLFSLDDQDSSSFDYDERIIPTRPIANLVRRIDDIDSSKIICDFVIVGGGIAGIELAMSIHGKLDKKTITIIDSKEDILLDANDECRRALRKQLNDRNISIISKSRAETISDGLVTLHDGRKVKYSYCILATGAGAHPLAHNLSKRGISCSPSSNWIRVSPTLQSLSHENIFAAGDCCVIEGLEDGRISIPKAGVYAVRAGPILIENITKILNYYTNLYSVSDEKNELQQYTPQDDFLKLLVCGDGNALGFRFGCAFYGKWVWNLKDYIDKKFLDLFDEAQLPDCSAKENSAHVDCCNEVREIQTSGKYDTSQYDAQLSVFDLSKVSPNDAANLLLKTDDTLAPELAWSILRNMTLHESYREDIIHRYKEGLCVKE